MFLFKSQITPILFVILNLIIYLGIYAFYIFYIQSIGLEIGGNSMDNNLTIYFNIYNSMIVKGGQIMTTLKILKDISSFSCFIKPLELDISVLYLFFRFSLLSKVENYLNNLLKSEQGQVQVYNKLIYSKRSNSTSTSININSMVTLARKDFFFLDKGSIFNLELKDIIKNVVNNEVKSRLEGQYKLEKICVLNEEVYFKKLILSLKDKDTTKNLVRLKIVNDWEYKLNNALIKYIQSYLKNTYNKLIEDINKRGRYAKIILLILCFGGYKLPVSDSILKNKKNTKKYLEKSYKIISLMLSIIMRLLVINEELGDMKLEYEIKHGIFIKKKLYALLTKNNKEVIKASGAKSKLLQFNNFITLLNGQNINTERLSFNVNWKELKINIVKIPITLKGLDHPCLTLFNTKDTNFKFISNTKNYPLIIYNNNKNYYFEDPNYKNIKNIILGIILDISKGKVYKNLASFRSNKSLELFIFKLKFEMVQNKFEKII